MSRLMVAGSTESSPRKPATQAKRVEVTFRQYGHDEKLPFALRRARGVNGSLFQPCHSILLNSLRPQGPSAIKPVASPLSSTTKVASYRTNILLKNLVSDNGRNTIVAAPGSSPKRFQSWSFSLVMVMINLGSSVF